MVEMASDGISILDSAMRFVFVNPALETMLDYAPGELMGATLASVTHESFPMRKPEQQRWRKGEIERIEYCHRRKDGAPLWVILGIAPIVDESGTVTGCVGVSHDITADRELRTALARSEEAYHGIFNNLQDVYFEVDLRGTLTRVSPSCLRHTGFTPDELAGQPVSHLLTDEDALGDIVEVLQRDGTVADYETIFERKDGEHIWVSIAISASRGADGELRGYHGMFHDITARRRAEADRDRLFALSVDMLAVVSSDGVFVRVNPAFTETTGHPVSELEGQNTMKYCHPEDRGRAALAHSTQLVRGQPVRDLRVRFLCADGSYRWISMNISCADAGDFFAVVRDVSALVAAEERERELSAERERLLDEAEYAASHDALTGLLNRRKWFALAEEADYACLALFDIDHFKDVNDTCGHPAGDAVLRAVGERMEAALGGNGFLALIGGEEFGALITLPFAGAVATARAMLEAVRETPIRLPDGRTAEVTLSAGIAARSVMEDGDREAGAGATYAAADGALYRAKAAGRARLEVSVATSV